jgi:hypothetical protein
MVKKITGVILVLMLMLGVLCGCVQQADSAWAIPEDKYTGLEEFRLDESKAYSRDMGNGETVDYALAQETAKYALYINKDRLDIAFMDKTSGEVWFSNPTDAVIKASGKSYEMMSQLQLSIVNKSDSSVSNMDSYTNSISKVKLAQEQGFKINPFYLTYNDKGGLRVKYVMGDFVADYVMPAVMPEEVYNELCAIANDIYRNIIFPVDKSGDAEQIAAAKEKWGALYQINKMVVQSYFETIDKATFDAADSDTKEKFTANVPGIVNLEEGKTVACMKQRFSPLAGNGMQALFDLWFNGGEKYGYTLPNDDNDQPIKPGKERYTDYESASLLREAWDAEYEVKEASGDLFMIPVDYIIEDDGLKVQIKQEEVCYNESKYAISGLSVMKYFGSADNTETGYMLVPDGSGAIINFNNGKIAVTSELKVQIYGLDRGKNYSTKPEYSEQGYLPVWGIKKQSSSLFAIIESGESAATIISDIPRGSKNSVNYTNASFKLCEFDEMTLFGNSQKLLTYQEKRFSGDIAIKYQIMNGDVNYSDMAANYRSYLINKGMLNSEKLEAKDINFNLELFGAMSDTSAVMGIQYDYLNSLTTYEEARKILEELGTSGVKGINLRYRGWSNNGLMNQAYGAVSPLRELGGWNGYRKLEEYAQANGVKLYPECEIVKVYTDKLFDNYMQYLDASRMLSRSNAVYYQYDQMQSSAYVHQAFITRPQKVDSMADSLIKDLAKNNISSISLGSIGEMLTADYHVGATYDRDMVQKVYAQVYKKFADAGISIASVGGNAYALAGTDVLFELPNQSSEYYVTDAAVPFYQMVLHGYVQYSGEAANQSGDPERTLLKAVEYGAGLSYRWMYASNRDINNIYFEDLYSANYSSWINDAAAFYKRYNEELGHTASLTIAEHKNITKTLSCTRYSDGTVVYVNYDEVSAEVDGHRVPAMDYLVVKGV